LVGHHAGHFRFDPEAGTIGRYFVVLGRFRQMAMKLYVGNLSYEVTNASLEELFAPYGAVRSAQVIQDRDTGRSKGFGFVEMADDNAARAAIAALHEKESGGRPLIVNEARPREERGFGGGGGGGGRRGGGGGGGRRY
jgi:RNA recognition motif-containing protein